MTGKSLVTRFAETYGVEANKLLDTLQKTVFKEARTHEQFMSLLVVSEQYKLNPFTREIYAFPDNRGGVTPVVSIDGWLNIINSHPQFNGMSISFSEEMAQVNGVRAPEYCTVSIYRKDRDHPTVLSEYFEEVFRPTDPWRQSPRRMLRHKTIIQCGRVAFGFSGIYEQDEAERIADTRVEKPATGVTLESLKAAEPPVENAVSKLVEYNDKLQQSPEWPKWSEDFSNWIDSDGVVYHPEVHVNGDPPPVTQAGCFRARRGKATQAIELASQVKPGKAPAPADTEAQPDAIGEDPPWPDIDPVGDSPVQAESP